MVEASALTTVPPSFLLLSGVILILNKQSTSYNEDTDIRKLVKENNRQKTRGRLESPCSLILLTDVVVFIIKREDKKMYRRHFGLVRNE